MGAPGGCRVLNVAHRGASSVAPPNTLAAVLKAHELGADGIEFDVRLSADGLPVVAHDATVTLPSGRAARVADLTLEVLKGIDVGGRFGPAYRGERIPTLEELLRCASGSLLMDIELKTAEALDAGLVRATVAEVERVGTSGDVLISSFNPLALLQARRAAPHIPVALLGTRRFLRPPLLALLAALMQADALHPEHSTVGPRSVAQGRRRGLRVHTWTVDDRDEMERLIDLGVNGIITNVPGLLGQVLQARRRRKTADGGRPRTWLNTV
jgi:glycerophosphoryl diester phosphodiesterase